MCAYRAPFAPPASRRPLHVFPRHILRSKPWLATIERRLEASRGLPRSSGRRTISRSGSKNSKNGAGSCRGPGLPKSLTADTTFGKTHATTRWRRSNRILDNLHPCRRRPLVPDAALPPTELPYASWMKTDARTWVPETQEHLRKQAIRWRKQGMSDVAIAEPLEVHRSTVSNGWRAYQAEGVRGIRSPTRGRKPGEQSTLSPRQEKQIQDLIRDKTPDQYKLSFAPWTRQAVQKLIRLRLNRTMPPRTMGETLKRWGFTL